MATRRGAASISYLKAAPPRAEGFRGDQLVIKTTSVHCGVYAVDLSPASASVGQYCTGKQGITAEHGA